MATPREHERELLTNLRRSITAAVRDTAKEIQSAAQQNAPVRSGRLKRATGARTVDGRRIEVSSGRFYGRILDQGKGRSRGFKGWLGQPVEEGSKALEKRLQRIPWPSGKVIRP